MWRNTFAPLDKSYCIRMGVLDLLAGKDDTVEFLKERGALPTDLAAVRYPSLRRTESATLFRFMTFASWKFDRADLRVEKVGTLRRRGMCCNPVIVDLSQEDLLQLDNGTSQWASAAAICGDTRRIDGAPAKLLLTYKAIADWENDCRDYRPDPTIVAQMQAFVDFAETGRMEFVPAHSEDYCFAKAFGLITAAEGEAKWPSLKGHESNRLKEMERALEQGAAGDFVISDDHRVVQALALAHPGIHFMNPGCVRKSWPRFWEFAWAAQNGQRALAAKAERLAASVG